MVAAQTAPDSENGRYTFSPSADGMMRLDTQDRDSFQLQQFRLRLGLLRGAGRTQGAGRGNRPACRRRTTGSSRSSRRASGKPDDKPAGPSAAENHRKIEIPLPSDQDVDRVMSLLQRAWKRLVEMANQMQKDISGGGKI